MLTVTLPALASHNSFGAPHTHILDPDEADIGGSGVLNPDIPHEDHPDVDAGTVSPYHLGFHGDTLGEGDNPLPPREAPIDQTGDRYTDCDTWESFNGDEAAYQEALRSGDACYVGYFDQIFEHSFPTLPLIVTECPCDLLYPANPSPDDRYCRGEEETTGISATIPETGGEIGVTTGIEPVDVILTNAWRVTDQNCGTGNDNSFLSGNILFDVSLLESPQEGAADALGNDVGSGSYTLEGFSTTYIFLLGQPHPDNKAGDTLGEAVDGVDSNRTLSGPSPFEAGSGPFGPNPAELGNPMHDMEGACGDRTQECTLLTPSDIILYDPWTMEGDPSPMPRVCAFLPQYSFSVAGGDGSVDRDQGVCGNTGNQYDEFVDDLTAGGFGIQDGPPTWITNLPGWSWGVIFTGIPSDNTDTYAEAYLDEDLEHRPGVIGYFAVNPTVANREGDLRCVVPNILTDGDSNVDLGGFEDPGVYGTYQADAIDVDIYTHPLRPQLEGVNEDTHDEVRLVVGPAQDTASDATDATQAIGDITDQVLPEAIADEIADALDRAEYFESSESPAHAQPGSQNQATFPASISGGLACDAADELRFNDAETPLDAGLRFEASLTQFTTNLKDPTLFDENDLPAPESETDEGYWQVDMYSFNGNAQGVIDFTQNGAFDDCPGANVNLGDDLCSWESLWDAYSGAQCTDRQNNECGENLKEWGYDTDEGVGAYFVLEVTGPVLVTSSPIATQVERIVDQTRLLGAENPTAQNCIVGTTIGFEDKLVNHIDGATTVDEIADAVCDVDGESTLIVDAFSPQSGVTPGTFSSRVSWAPLLPTPDASDLDEGDSLCVTGIWSTQALEQASTTDTAGDNNIDLAADGSVHMFHHWQSLETGTDTPGHKVLPTGQSMC